MKCSGLLQELIRLCTQQNKQNALLKAENTSLKEENTSLDEEIAMLNNENQALKARIAELETRTVPSVPTDGIAPVPSVPIDGAAPAADVPPVPTDGAPPATDDEAAADRKALRTRILFAAGSKTSHQQVGKDSSATVDIVPAPQYASHTEIYAPSKQPHDTSRSSL